MKLEARASSPTRFSDQRAKRRVTDRSDFAGFQGVADRAAGLAVVPAIAEAAASQPGTEFAEAMLDVLDGQVMEPELL